MLHKAYIPEREQIVEVIGTVRYDDGVHFVFWNQNFCKYDDVHVGDCVPYRSGPARRRATGVDPRGDGQFDGGPTGGFDGQ
jgi:hypothetical protein